MKQAKKLDVKKVALAYSGGLDTSIIIPWLIETYGCEVIAVCGDVGQGAEVDAVRKKALDSGASKCYVGDLVDEFIADYVFPTLQAGAKYETYLLGTAMARPLIAKYLVDIALAEGCDAICHGCTGKGNDQVRFELSVKALAPQMKIIAPWREWDLVSRDQEIEYAKQRNIPVPVSKEDNYSRDRNLWHLSHEGMDLEDPWNEYKPEMLQICVPPEKAPDTPEYVEIDFEEGIPVAVNGEKLGPAALVSKLNEIGAKHGVGVDSLVENRLVGMKSHGVYENPGGAILYAAHDALESITLDKETMHFKQNMAVKYAELVYNGQMFMLLKEALDAFVKVTQQTVTGTARVKLYKGSVTVSGIKSPYSLYNEAFATFGEDDVYDQADAAGFINLFGLPIKVKALMEQGK